MFFSEDMASWPLLLATVLVGTALAPVPLLLLLITEFGILLLLLLPVLGVLLPLELLLFGPFIICCCCCCWYGNFGDDLQERRLERHLDIEDPIVLLTYYWPLALTSRQDSSTARQHHQILLWLPASLMHRLLLPPPPLLLPLQPLLSLTKRCCWLNHRPLMQPPHLRLRYCYYYY